MKKTEIYNFLTSDSIKDEEKFNAFLTDLKNDIAIETAQEKSGSRKQRLQKCISLIVKSKAHQSDYTCGLKKYVMFDNKQTVVLGNVSGVACLVEKDFINGLEEETEKKRFIDLNIISRFIKKDLSKKAVINIFDLHIKLRAKEKLLKFDCGEKYKICFEIKTLIDMLYLLNIDNQKEFTICYDPSEDLAIIKCDSGSYGILGTHYSYISNNN